MNKTFYHIPVLLNEVLMNLNLKEDSIIVDATCGEGGHAEGILKMIPHGKLICLDRNQEILQKARERLSAFSNVSFCRVSFINIGEVVKEENVKPDGILADLGISMYHYQAVNKGFSYMDSDSLDMRLDSDLEISASMVINSFGEKKIADILFKYGEEYESRKIANAIVRARPINSARELADLILKVKKNKKRSKIHPATKTFQALRIFVNKELENLESFIPVAVDNLKENGRLLIISYHSLEDRLVKHTFRRLSEEGKGFVYTKKPIIPDEEEIKNNRSARSARMRIFVKTV